MKTCEGCRWAGYVGVWVDDFDRHPDAWTCWREPGTPRRRTCGPDAPPACCYREEATPARTDDDRIKTALSIARGYGQFDGGHHKAWAIDQMCRALLGEGYAAFVTDAKAGEDGPETYGWDEGIAP